MAAKERQRNYNWFLDKEKENALFIRFVFTEDGKSLEEFSISYCTIRDYNFYEIVRYDCSGQEAVHVHRFYQKLAVKQQLEKEKSFGTMAELVELIEKNWRLYKLKFLEKQQFI